jgi:hypothetical protein
LTIAGRTDRLGLSEVVAESQEKKDEEMFLMNEIRFIWDEEKNKTLEDVLRQGKTDNLRLTRREYMRDEDIDTTDMPPLTTDELARGIPGRLRTPHVWTERRLADILPLSEESIARLERLKGIKDEDIDTSDMPELTDEQLARMEPTRFIDRREQWKIIERENQTGNAGLKKHKVR